MIYIIMYQKYLISSRSQISLQVFNVSLMVESEIFAAIYLLSHKKVSLIKKKCLCIKQICALLYGQRKFFFDLKKFLDYFFPFELKN